MLKHIIAITVISLIIIISMPNTQKMLQYVFPPPDWFSAMLKEVFSVDQAGDIIRQLIALLVIPLVVSLIPAIIYWLARRQKLPYFMELVWVVWLVQTAAIVITFKAA